jgi:hypothetical protein
MGYFLVFRHDALLENVLLEKIVILMISLQCVHNLVVNRNPAVGHAG